MCVYVCMYVVLLYIVRSLIPAWNYDFGIWRVKSTKELTLFITRSFSAVQMRYLYINGANSGRIRERVVTVNGMT